MFLTKEALMLNKNIYPESILGLLVLAAVLYFRGSLRLELAGCIYLMFSAGIVAFGSLVFASIRKERGDRNPALWVLQRKLRVVLIVAWQLAILGLLNILAVAELSFGVFAINYLAATFFIILSYRLVALADSSSQGGGYVPVSYFGRPKSRKLLFGGFVIAPLSMLAYAGIIILYKWKWCPYPFLPAQVCLLLLSLSSGMSSGLIIHRYWGAPPERRLALRLLLLTVVGLTCTAIIHFTFIGGLYDYALSSVTVVCLAATVYWLSLARVGA